MEEDSIRFLKKVSWSLLMSLAWLFINIGVSMYNGWVVPDHGLQWKHVFFYLWAIASTAWMIRMIIQIWKS